jgi:hypothetical protein
MNSIAGHIIHFLFYFLQMKALATVWSLIHTPLYSGLTVSRAMLKSGHVTLPPPIDRRCQRHREDGLSFRVPV